MLMRTTIEIPDNLLNEAMKLTNIKTKTELIRQALQNLITQARVARLKDYYGKINLSIDLETLRLRDNNNSNV